MEMEGGCTMGEETTGASLKVQHTGFVTLALGRNFEQSSPISSSSSI